MKPLTLRQAHIDWFLRNGVTMEALMWPEAVMHTETEIYFPDDDALWNPVSDHLSGHFCLGADGILDADQYAFDGALVIHETPLQWLKAMRRGIVIIDWSRLFDQLRDVPRVSVPKSLMAQYRKHMKVPRLPDVRIAA